jgi:transcriptional regulator with PAS, ATPase and Fis domain
MMDRQIVVPLYSLLDTRDNPTVLVDKNYRIVAANKAYCTSYGIPADQIIGKACHEVSHRSDRPCHLNGEQCPHQEVFATLTPCEALHTHLDFQGRPDHVRILAHPIHDADGQMYLMESIHRLAPNMEMDCEEMRMAGKSPAFLKFYEELSDAARTTASVWLFGESGVGKELAARFLHDHSARTKKSFVELNCASIPESLCESELFGHEKGAFSGAVSQHRGRFERAHRGTLLLDEVGNLSMAMQAKLLRVIQTKTFERVGGEKSIVADVRVIAASNRSLEEMINDGTFRRDLYHRLNVVQIRMPALRERLQDVPELVNHFLARYAAQAERHAPQWTPAAMARLQSYEWPGNVRELENFIYRVVLLCQKPVIDAEDVNTFLATQKLAPETPPPLAPSPTENTTPSQGQSVTTPSATLDLSSQVEVQEKDIIARALARNHYNLSRTAKELKISRTTLYTKLSKYGISMP